MSGFIAVALEFVKRNRLYVGLALAFFFGGCYAGCTAQRVRDHLFGAPPPPVGVGSFGWVDDPDQVKRIVATFQSPYFGDAAKGLVQGDNDRDALLYKLYEKVAGHPWKAHDQDGTGCCVGEGFSGAVEMLTCVEIALAGEREEFKPISAAVMYGLSREAGGMLGGPDGSSGAAAAKAIQRFGCVSSEEAGDDNTTGAQHGQLAKKFGGRSGVPDALKTIGAKHLVKTASLVRTPEEVQAALVNGYPVTICSSVGFEGHGGFKRDEDGFCHAGGSWPHCMYVAAYRKDKRAFLIVQSWGERAPPGPKSLDQPDCSFWCEWKDMQRIVSAGDSYALSAFDGYKARKLDVFIRAPGPRREFVAGKRFLDFALAY